MRRMSGRIGRSPLATLGIDRASIERARRSIDDHIRTTPIVTTAAADFGLPCRTLTFKLEQLQHSGSFKARGAFLNLVSRAVPATGVAAASGGNHGVAVAYAAMRMRVHATIFVPAVASPAKVQRIREYGAELRIVGERYADALAESERWVGEMGALAVHAFDQKETVLGQATLALELAGQAPGLDTILVPVGGGGLIAGVSAWYAGTTRIVGVEPVLAPTLSEALKAGRPVDAAAGGIAADSLAPRRVGDLIFPILRAFVERVVLVSDEQIRSAQNTLWNALRIVAEPGGATAFAALQSGGYKPEAHERVGVIISGGNTVWAA
jgi:threonine dehydratase